MPFDCHIKQTSRDTFRLEIECDIDEPIIRHYELFKTCTEIANELYNQWLNRDMERRRALQCQAPPVEPKI